MTQAPKIDVDAEGAWLLPWARRQLARFKRAMRWGHKRFDLPGGATVRLTWGALDRIRITAATVLIRAWKASLSIKAKTDASVQESRAFTGAGWDKQFATFVYTSGSDVVVTRGDATITLEDCHAPFDVGPVSFYQNPVAAVAPAGAYVVTIPDAPSYTCIARCAVYDSDAASWSQVDVPLPPDAGGLPSQPYTSAGVPNNTGFPSGALGMANAGEDSISGYFVTDYAVGPQQALDIVVQSLIPGLFYANTASIAVPGLMWRAFVDPYKVDAVYLDLRYWESQALGLIFYIETSPGSWVGEWGVRLTPRQGIWKYDLATRSWSKPYTDDSAGTWTVYGSVPVPGSGFDGFGATLGSAATHADPSAGTPLDAEFVYFSPVFDPYLGLRVARIDNRSGGSRSSSATMTLDGAVWMALTGVATDDETLPVVIRDAGNFMPLQLGLDSRGALPTGQWRYDEAGSVVTLGGTSPLMFSKDMRYAVAEDTKFYKDGVLAYEHVDADDFVFLAMSYDSPGRALASLTIHDPGSGSFSFLSDAELSISIGSPTTSIPNGILFNLVSGPDTLQVSEGVLHVEGTGDIPVTEASGFGIDVNGGGLWFPGGSTPPSDTTSLRVFRFPQDDLGAYSEAVAYVVPLTYTVSGTPETFSTTQVYPNECVIG